MGSASGIRAPHFGISKLNSWETDRTKSHRIHICFTILSVNIIIKVCLMYDFTLHPNVYLFLSLSLYIYIYIIHMCVCICIYIYIHMYTLYIESASPWNYMEFAWYLKSALNLPSNIERTVKWDNSNMFKQRRGFNIDIMRHWLPFFPGPWPIAPVQHWTASNLRLLANRCAAKAATDRQIVR